MRRDNGFTLIEVLTTMLLLSLLLTLGAAAFRQFWFAQALEGSQDELVSQLRQRQEQAVSESHPRVFGVRLLEGSSGFGLVEYTPDDSTTVANEQSCVETGTPEFSSGVKVEAGGATFSVPAESDWCGDNLVYSADLGGGAVDNRATSDYVLFYPRGTATGGAVTLMHADLESTRTVTVTPITGRVESS